MNVRLHIDKFKFICVHVLVRKFYVIPSIHYVISIPATTICFVFWIFYSLWIQFVFISSLFVTLLFPINFTALALHRSRAGLFNIRMENLIHLIIEC